MEEEKVTGTGTEQEQEKEKEYSLIEERHNEMQAQENKSDDFNASSRKLGCGTWLLISFVLLTLFMVYDLYFGESDYHDPNDWNFDGKVDYDDAVKKLEWRLKNE